MNGWLPRGVANCMAKASKTAQKDVIQPPSFLAALRAEINKKSAFVWENVLVPDFFRKLLAKHGRLRSLAPNQVVLCGLALYAACTLPPPRSPELIVRAK